MSNVLFLPFIECRLCINARKCRDFRINMKGKARLAHSQSPPVDVSVS